MPNYLSDIGEYTIRSAMDGGETDELEVKRPGWLMANALILSSIIDARLVTRADLQASGGSFLSPYPEIVKGWVVELLTPKAYDALGRKPSDETWSNIVERAKTADAQLLEAADPEKGLLRLPLQQGATKLQTVEPATLAYSEQSPYTSKHLQFDAVKNDSRYG